MKKMLLPDVNVWLALSFSAHTHHPSANTWFRSLTDETCYFCRMTQQGFLRLATNPTVLKADAVSLSGAWHLYDTMLTDPRIDFAQEPAGLDPLWRTFTQGSTFSTHVWNDAYLAAFALAGDLEVVTFDKGFARYPGLKVTILH
jgi:toxin-antitoxin system PIN domain toxin